MKIFVKVIGCAIILVLSCIIIGGIFIYKVSNNRTGHQNIDIYENTEVWDLAKAVDRQKTGKIKKIAKEHPEYLNFKDKEWDMTLLLWAVGNEKYEAAKALLESGANPNIPSYVMGFTPLFEAAGYSFRDKSASKNPKYVKLLLDAGADPNIGFVGSTYSNIYDIGETPLMRSIGCGIEKTKLLVDAGADINAKK